ncbi:MAG: bifunctional UDP-N-acetylglucosamine diphosphorylase/glucosamine-1-phosphate N-acetyltransferase GlmU [Legionellaceae bacterium]|nr:bifunctional UDP-N-acetylglucosamine diphosphorylase/glucosamine-1-phosphate N-acetyltransferase GlmU [Legionellaceae bacterium]
MSLHIIILAAGMGKRMHSRTPKILHTVGGQPMFAHVVKTARSLNPAGIHVIIGHESERIRQAFATLPINWVEQREQLGTGHAVRQALPHIPNDATILILSADTPLIQTLTIKPLIEQCMPTHSLGLLLATLTNPFGLGRVERNANKRIYAIVEEKDANDQQRQIREIYTGTCCAKASDLNRWLPKLSNNNAQKEYYLTEIISMAVRENLPILSIEAYDHMDVQGVNDREQLQLVERAYQHRLANQLFLAGVTLADASRVDIRGELHCGRDVFIDVNNVFSGTVTLGDNSSVEPNCMLTNVTVGANCKIFANSVLEDCVVGDNCRIGPFARIRPGTQLATDCHIGNFVEVKNTVFGEGSKANHLSYLGDATIGTEVNIGAGTITCNYDGANKHRTIIEDGVHIGSDTQLVAPITIGKNATIGAGSTIRRNAPSGELTLTTSIQKTIPGWKRPIKK